MCFTVNRRLDLSVKLLKLLARYGIVVLPAIMELGFVNDMDICIQQDKLRKVLYILISHVFQGISFKVRVLVCCCL